MTNITLNNNNIKLNSVFHKLNNIQSKKEEQEKSVEITKNGITEVLPDEGKTLSKVNVDIKQDFINVHHCRL